MLSQQEKNLSIKFSHIDNFWTSARLVLALLSILSWLSWLQFIFLRTERFLFIKDLLLFISSAMQSVWYWKEDKQMSHNATSGGDNYRASFLFCPSRQKNWQNGNRLLKRTAQLYSVHHLSPYSQMLKKFSIAVPFSIVSCAQRSQINEMQEMRTLA